MAKATTTIRQILNHKLEHGAWFAANQALMKGRIFRYSQYKAWNQAGIITCRVNPKNTSRECARCGAQVIRYAQGEPEAGYQGGAPLVVCPECKMRGHADRNASINIGRKLLAR